ncbi:MAG: HAMP domain-containing histidine kinase [Pontiellaceae bacterium]|nr:HAMP domain-containing histidine kinase [Pontiellaceae bacterium]MBN2785912.1 HAMP domain-containing histidine kinase [Pontiellaceae bacterium]
MEPLNDQELIQLLQQHFERVSGIHQVMDELKESNRKLMESEALKSRFLSNIRNEINNPLAAVLGVAANMANTADPDALKTQAALISREAHNLSFQLENIFSAAELEAGELIPTSHKVSVISIIQQVLDDFESLISEKELEVELSTSPNIEEKTVFSDERMLRTVFANLIHNAINFSNRTQPIYIRIEQDNRCLLFSVRDHGIGIAPQDQSLIFDRFRQLDEGRCKAHQGHGLGLSVTQAILEQMGGRIEIESKPGEGTCFSITIPYAAEGEDLGPEGNELLFMEEDTETF